ncbi:hypothetical protein [Leptolyngbya ohadii]|uniref:hypothetical protein n=1 Tax=Leptolyngbya ohadii TaxID=1962290 RepID=UPI000B59E913|nr:hypothetical protein [Leptolyngbya ohadii]
MRTVKEFAEVIDHLLLIGAIEGAAVMQFYHLLMDFEQCRIEATVLKQAIDQHVPDRFQEWVDERLPPLSE